MRKLFLILCLVFVFSTTTLAAEPLAHMDTEYGIIDVVGYEVKYVDNELVLFIIYDWENTTDEPECPGHNFGFVGYQNGIEVEDWYCSDYRPSDCVSPLAHIPPGDKLRYNECFKLFDTSPIDMDLHLVKGISTISEFTINPSAAEGNADIANANDTSNSSEPEASTTNEIIAQLEKRISDLEARVAALEG